MHLEDGNLEVSAGSKKQFCNFSNASDDPTKLGTFRFQVSLRSGAGATFSEEQAEAMVGGPLRRSH